MLPLARPPENLCILRLSALGDATHVVPAIRAIQFQWPETRITWIIGNLEHRLLSGLDDVEFIPFDKKGGFAAIAGLRKALRERRFDVLLHMQVAARANLLSTFVRAPIRLGWDAARSRDMHRFFVRQQVRAVPFQHQVEGFLEFPKALGIDPHRPRWDLPITAEARDWATDRLGSEQPTLLISPCSSHAARNWSAAHYAEVADYAVRELSLQVALAGGPSALEKETAAAIEERMTQKCINLVGKDTLEQSKALLKHAAVVISPDSGPAHIASALGTPVIGLYAATWSKRSGPYNSLDLCVDRFEQAARQFRGKDAKELRWGTRIEVPGVMDLIQPPDVIEQLQAWFTSRNGGNR